MVDINAMLLSDTYKQIHRRIYPEGLTMLVSYWLPRKSMFKDKNDKMIFFGLQGFIKEYLIDYFDKNFFNKSEEEIIKSYKRYMDIQIGAGNYDLDSIIELHRHEFLPIQIRALPEGTKVKMGIPCIEIRNTDDKFAWVVQFIECILQASLWKSCCHATLGYKYHNLAKEFYDKTVDNNISPFDAIADFGLRGMSCIDEAIHASAAWLLSFNKTSTIPAIPYIEEIYCTDCKENKIGVGAVSTEHSCQGANYMIDGDEISFVKRMLTELYPNTSFSMVADTYDYWNFVNNILPKCKKEIMSHNGKMLVRPDSGEVIDISVKTVQKLWDIFGGVVNEKGYKVLDSHIGIIYGDGCQIETVREIWTQLEKLGFAANCITFGIGAFCFSATMEDRKLIALTRDTYGIAMKATFGAINDKTFPIYKDPKTDTNHLKKSYRGCCKVYEENGELKCEDGYNYFVSEDCDDFSDETPTLLKTVFKNGRLIKEDNFLNIRNRIYGEV